MATAARNERFGQMVDITGKTARFAPAGVRGDRQYEPGPLWVWVRNNAWLRSVTSSSRFGPPFPNCRTWVLR